MKSAGERNRLVRLSNPGQTPDGEGGYTEGWIDLEPAEVWAHMNPATPADMERAGAGATLSIATYVFDLLFHPQVTPETRIVFADPYRGDRSFQVTSVRNPDEQFRELVVVAQEIVE